MARPASPLYRLRKHGTRLPMPRAARHLVARAAARLQSSAPIEPVPGYQFGQVLAPRRARQRYALWALGRFFRLDDCPATLQWRGLVVNSYLGNDLSRCLYVGGGYEPNELTFVLATLARGDVFVDVGANEGIYSLVGAQAVGSDGRVIAIEPSERELSRLRGNLAMNAGLNVTVVPSALLDEARSVVLHVANPHHAGQNTLGGFVYDGVTREGDATVDATTLDQLLADLEVDRVRLIKIDVEGAECSVLRGARSTLARHRPILLVEAQDESLLAQGASLAELLSLLDEANYVVAPFSEATGLPDPTTAVDNRSMNVVAFPRPVAAGATGRVDTAVTLVTRPGPPADGVSDV